MTILGVLTLTALCCMMTSHAVTDQEFKDALKALQKQIDNIKACGITGGRPDLVELDNGFYLAFRGTEGVGKDVYEKYLSPGDDDNIQSYSTLPCGCLTVDGRDFCDRHYKSRIITLWEFMEIEWVRVSIYNKGKERVYWEFKGKGTDSLDFFDVRYLTSSSYEDTSRKTEYNYFSIEGHVDRHFFINQEYAGNCNKDKGWFVVLDGARRGHDNCKWTEYTHYPVFLYSGETGATDWTNGDVQSGDVFVIGVKFKKGSDPNSVAATGKCLPL